MLHIIDDPHFYVEVVNNPMPESSLPGLLEYLASTPRDYKLLELAQISFNCTGFPHSVPVQLRTHRFQITFDVQSQRYTGKRAIMLAKGELELEEVFYLRPGISSSVVEQQILSACKVFADLVSQGVPYEAARDVLPQGIRQGFVFSCSLRTLLHVLDLRLKPNAQAEIQTLSYMLLQQAFPYYPKILQDYKDNRALSGILAP